MGHCYRHADSRSCRQNLLRGGYRHWPPMPLHPERRKMLKGIDQVISAEPLLVLTSNGPRRRPTNLRRQTPAATIANQTTHGQPPVLARQGRRENRRRGLDRTGLQPPPATLSREICLAPDGSSNTVRRRKPSDPLSTIGVNPGSIPRSGADAAVEVVTISLLIHVV